MWTMNKDTKIYHYGNLIVLKATPNMITMMLLKYPKQAKYPAIITGSWVFL